MSTMSWTCSHGCSYSEAELECGFSFAYMDWVMEQERLEYEIESDLAHEALMARALAYSMEPGFETLWEVHEYQEACDAALVPWPWYADPPVVEVRPQIFTPIKEPEE